MVKIPNDIATAYGSNAASSDIISKECLTASGSAKVTLQRAYASTRK